MREKRPQNTTSAVSPAALHNMPKGALIAIGGASARPQYNHVAGDAHRIGTFSGTLFSATARDRRPFRTCDDQDRSAGLCPGCWRADLTALPKLPKGTHASGHDAETIAFLRWLRDRGAPMTKADLGWDHTYWFALEGCVMNTSPAPMASPSRAPGRPWCLSLAQPVSKSWRARTQPSARWRRRSDPPCAPARPGAA
jgi:hypothetical protein